MKRFFAVPLALAALAGCGGGESSTSSPFLGTYGSGFATANALQPDGNVRQTIYENASARGSVARSGRFTIRVPYVSGVASREDVISGRISRDGKVEDAIAAASVHGPSIPPTPYLLGGLGQATRSGNTVQIVIVFPNSGGEGSFRYDLNVGP